MIKFLGIFIYLLSVSVSLAAVITETCENSEKCRDRRMHPNFNLEDLIVAKNEDELKASYWLNNAKKFVEEQIVKEHNKNIAKNVIFFIGDGMSYATQAAARVYIGGEEKSLSFQTFPYTGAVKTYCIDRQVPDSASTATAYLTGVKGNYGTTGVNGHVKRKDCSPDLTEYHTKSIAAYALEAGKDAGIVTTTRVTHASPSGVYVHTAEREWENDSKVKKDCKRLSKKFPKDIAEQLISGAVGSKLKVILGGGRREFRDHTISDEEHVKGARSDGQDLIKLWLSKGENNTYVWNRKDLLSVDPKTTDKLLGLFQSSHMLYHLEAKDDGKSEDKPTLAEMTKKAIEMLQSNEKGFFLFVEGGKIDLAHHDVYAKIALDETAELSKAVEIAMKMTNTSDTLIVVSSDHSHTFSFGGYPDRHNDIFGTADISDRDFKPYMTLSYANGLGFDKYFDRKTNTRLDPTTVVTDKSKMRFPSTIPITTETHGGEDVPVYASGPWSHLFTGIFEQSHLPYLMAYASCIGDGIKACEKK